MKRLFTFFIVLFGISVYVNAQATLEGKVSDNDTGAPLDYAYIKIYKGNNMISGTQTDIDGNFVITNIDNGTYDVEASNLGYTTERKTKVVLGSGKVVRVNFKLILGGVQLDVVTISEYRAPLVDIDNTTTGSTVTAEKIQSLPTKSVNAIAATTAGVATINGGDLNIRGGRASGTAYYVDGVRVIGLIPQSEIEQMQVITGGLEARYGDATGGLVSMTSKGPSQKTSFGVELETSQYLDPYGYNLGSAYISGPIFKKKGQTVLGYRLSYQFLAEKDDRPSALGYYRAPASVIKSLEENPVLNFKGAKVINGNFLRASDIGEKLNSAPNEEATDHDINARIDLKVSKNLDLALTGSYKSGVNRFTPSKVWSLLNYQNNPYFYDNSHRVNFRIRQKFFKQGIDVDQNNQNKSGTLLRNGFFTINAAYEKSQNSSDDYRHKKNYFNYGYYGSQTMELQEVIALVDPTTWHGPGQINGLDFVGYNLSFGDFKVNPDINPVLGKYNTVNGDENTSFNRIWDDMYYNVGQIYDYVGKEENERYNFNINVGFDILPNGSKKGRHTLEFGGIVEMRVNRKWALEPRKLWEIAHEQQNIWIVGVDTTHVIGTFPGNLGGVPVEWQRYDTKLNKNEDSKFYKKIRELLGKTEHDYVSVDQDVTPDMLKLEMFSGKELNDKRILGNNGNNYYEGYYGYDYLGNKLSNKVKFSDFWATHTEVGENGVTKLVSDISKKDFWSPAYNPLYGGIYIQDKFSYKDIIMRIGARIDYFDANTKVLKDPYALYEIENAKDFYNSSIYSDHKDFVRPESIEDDYKVYVSDDGSHDVIGYRKGDQWYLPNGTATDGNLIFKGGLVYPFYKERVDSIRNIQSKYYKPGISFEDYKPQVNFMPRIAFSFPISEDAGFFAHYDVLVQRPGVDEVVMTPIDYYYFQSTSGAIYNNPNLKPEKTIDYEVGFQQKLSNNSALKIQTYYREQRDMIRQRAYFFIPDITQYTTYGNLDYGTVKGFSFTYDFRRVKNLEFQLAYTLQFANGTGSDVNSAAGLTNRGIIRNLYATSFDERHRIAGVFDFRYFNGKQYNGPVLFGKNILEDFGLNFQVNAVSGRPYTKNVVPKAFSSSGYSGEIHGSRKPWYFEANIKFDKNIKINKNLEANIYLRIENVFNIKNVINVYGYTGDPDDDGFLLSTYGQDRVKKITEQGLPVDLFTEMYHRYLENSGNYSRPRRIYFGVMFNL